jgi:hypothetical protein
MPTTKQMRKSRKAAESSRVSPPPGSQGGKRGGKSEPPTKKKVGRPLGTFRVDLRDMCREVAEEAVAALRLALKDKTTVVPAANTLLSYGFGKPLATTVIRTIRSVEDLTEEELRLLAGETEDNALMIEGAIDGVDEDQEAG